MTTRLDRLYYLERAAHNEANADAALEQAIKYDDRGQTGPARVRYELAERALARAADFRAKAAE